MDENATISHVMQTIPFVDETIARVLTPPKRRPHSLLIGEFLAALPFFLLFLPFARYHASDFYFAFSIVITLVSVIAVGLVIFGKSKATEIASILDKIIFPELRADLKKTLLSVLAPHKQLIIGVLIALTLIFVAYMQPDVRNSPLAIKTATFIAVGYIGIIWGSGLYIVFCIPEVLSAFAKAKYQIQALYPYQQRELRQISEIASSITLTGAWFATLLITILVAVQFIIAYRFAVHLTGLFIFLGIFEILILIVALLVISLPFFSFHSFLSQIIKQAKEQRIEKLAEGMRKSIALAESGDAEIVDKITKLQSLIDQIERSPDSVLGAGTVGKYFSSILLTIIPILISTLIK